MRATSGRTTKRCGSCGNIKLLSEYSFHTVDYTGTRYPQSRCNVCRAKREKVRRNDPNKTYKENRKAYNLKREYNITLEEFEILRINQNNKCAICFIDFENSKCCVDHSHVTGQVRGLLCRPCNSFIGFAKDSKSILLSAVAYINKGLKNG